MQQIEIKLNILIDGMQKKEQALTEIASITENQSTVLSSALTEEEKRMFIVEMNREKQGFIQTVIQCDHLFEKILKEIGKTLDNHPHLFKPQIKDLQARIKRVMDLDVKIRVCEEQNNARMSVETGPLPATGSNDEAAEKTGGNVKQMPKPPNVKMPSATKQTAVLQDENRLIKAYESNTKNFKG